MWYDRAYYVVCAMAFLCHTHARSPMRLATALRYSSGMTTLPHLTACAYGLLIEKLFARIRPNPLIIGLRRLRAVDRLNAAALLCLWHVPL